MMPLITRRSSTRALRGVSVGNRGCTFESCSSLSQNNPSEIDKLLFMSLNQTQLIHIAILWV
ncbi:MAG: hypothetical protein AAFN16_04295 [Pseudomonadota bacterium]